MGQRAPGTIPRPVSDLARRAGAATAGQRPARRPCTPCWPPARPTRRPRAARHRPEARWIAPARLPPTCRRRLRRRRRSQPPAAQPARPPARPPPPPPSPQSTSWMSWCRRWPRGTRGRGWTPSPPVSSTARRSSSRRRAPPPPAAAVPGPVPRRLLPGHCNAIATWPADPAPSARGRPVLHRPLLTHVSSRPTILLLAAHRLTSSCPTAGRRRSSL